MRISIKQLKQIIREQLEEQPAPLEPQQATLKFIEAYSNLKQTRAFYGMTPNEIMNILKETYKDYFAKIQY